MYIYFIFITYPLYRLGHRHGYVFLKENAFKPNISCLTLNQKSIDGHSSVVQ